MSQWPKEKAQKIIRGTDKGREHINLMGSNFGGGKNNESKVVDKNRTACQRNPIEPHPAPS